MSTRPFVLTLLLASVGACSEGSNSLPQTRSSSALAATTTNFELGGNLEGNVMASGSQLRRGSPTAGVGAWSATAPFQTPRYSHASVATNGFLYVLGGANASGFLNDVQFAPIHAKP